MALGNDDGIMYVFKHGTDMELSEIEHEDGTKLRDTRRREWPFVLHERKPDKLWAISGN